MSQTDGIKIIFPLSDTGGRWWWRTRLCFSWIHSQSFVTSFLIDKMFRAETPIFKSDNAHASSYHFSIINENQSFEIHNIDPALRDSSRRHFPQRLRLSSVQGRREPTSDSSSIITVIPAASLASYKLLYGLLLSAGPLTPLLPEEL